MDKHKKEARSLQKKTGMPYQAAFQATDAEDDKRREEYLKHRNEAYQVPYETPPNAPRFFRYSRVVTPMFHVESVKNQSPEVDLTNYAVQQALAEYLPEIFYQIERWDRRVEAIVVTPKTIAGFAYNPDRGHVVQIPEGLYDKVVELSKAPSPVPEPDKILPPPEVLVILEELEATLFGPDTVDGQQAFMNVTSFVHLRQYASHRMDFESHADRLRAGFTATIYRSKDSKEHRLVNLSRYITAPMTAMMGPPGEILTTKEFDARHFREEVFERQATRAMNLAAMVWKDDAKDLVQDALGALGQAQFMANEGAIPNTLETITSVAMTLLKKRHRENQDPERQLKELAMLSSTE